MIKITVGDLLANEATLLRLQEESLPVLGAFNLAILARKVMPDIEAARKVHDSLFSDENSVAVEGSPGQRKLKPDCIEDFVRQIQPLLERVLEIDAKPLSLSDLAGATISARQLSRLGSLLASEL